MRKTLLLVGVGLIAVCPPADAEAVRSAAADAGVETWAIGEVVPGSGRVRWVDAER